MKSEIISTCLLRKAKQIKSKPTSPHATGPERAESRPQAGCSGHTAPAGSPGLPSHQATAKVNNEISLNITRNREGGGVALTEGN